jgi:hypothetical protein
MPTSTIAHATDSVTTSTSPAAASVPRAWLVRKPMSTPMASSSAIAQACLTRSATIRPASRENRAIGSDRSRSKKPFSRSVARPVAVFIVVNREFCTMMPGSK